MHRQAVVSVSLLNETRKGRERVQLLKIITSKYKYLQILQDNMDSLSLSLLPLVGRWWRCIPCSNT